MDDYRGGASLVPSFEIQAEVDPRSPMQPMRQAEVDPRSPMQPMRQRININGVIPADCFITVTRSPGEQS